MSTRTHVIIDHQAGDYRNTDAMIALLGPALPAAMAVERYWRSAEPGELGAECWAPRKKHTVVDYVDYLGPGGLLLHFSQRVVVISASARWSGFLTIEPLRAVHLSAFRRVAGCLRGSRLLLLPDASDVGYDAMREGMSQEECVVRLRQEYGPPQPSVEAIPAGAFEAYVPGSHLVWFNEAL